MSTRRKPQSSSLSKSDRSLIFSIATLVFLVLTILSGLGILLNIYYLITGSLVGSIFMETIGLTGYSIATWITGISSLIVSIVFFVIFFILYKFFNRKRKGM